MENHERCVVNKEKSVVGEDLWLVLGGTMEDIWTLVYLVCTEIDYEPLKISTGLHGIPLVRQMQENKTREYHISR